MYIFYHRCIIHGEGINNTLSSLELIPSCLRNFNGTVYIAWWQSAIAWTNDDFTPPIRIQTQFNKIQLEIQSCPSKKFPFSESSAKYRSLRISAETSQSPVVSCEYWLKRLYHASVSAINYVPKHRFFVHPARVDASCYRVCDQIINPW